MSLNEVFMFQKKWTYGIVICCVLHKGTLKGLKITTITSVHQTNLFIQKDKILLALHLIDEFVRIFL